MIAGIPHDLMITAMDSARQRRVATPALAPDHVHTITKLLGITPTCGNPQQVLPHIQTAPLVLGTYHPTHPSDERWMVITAALGVPDARLPLSMQPTIMTTVRAPRPVISLNRSSGRVTRRVGTTGQPMQDRLQQVKRRHVEDLAKGYGAVSIPYALKHTYPHANRERAWNDAFLVARLLADLRIRIVHRHPWNHLALLSPNPPYRTDVRDCPRHHSREGINGILWVMRTGVA